MIRHAFKPNPWPHHAHLCDAREVDEQDGRPRPCLRPRDEHAPAGEESSQERHAEELDPPPRAA